VRGRDHGARRRDEWEVATELNNVGLLAMELARLMLAPVPRIQDLASVELSPVTGRLMWSRWSSLCSLGDQSCGLHCRFV
jgi:hypothetical protein